MLADRICKIYMIRCFENGKVYIGSTVEPDVRKRVHFYSLAQGDHHNNHIQYDWDLYGSDSFSMDFIDECSESERKDTEQFWIDFYESSNPRYGYNMVHTVQDLPAAAVRSEISSGYWTEIHRKEQSERMKIRYKENKEKLYPILSKRTLDLQERLKNEPELKAKCVAGIRKSHGRKEFRDNHSIILTESWLSPVLREEQSVRVTEQHKNPELKARRLAGWENLRRQPNFKQEVGERAKRAYQRATPEQKAKQIAGLLAYHEKLRKLKEEKAANKDIVWTVEKSIEISI